MELHFMLRSCKSPSKTVVSKSCTTHATVFLQFGNFLQQTAEAAADKAMSTADLRKAAEIALNTLPRRKMPAWGTRWR